MVWFANTSGVSQENVEIVTGMLDRFKQGDRDSWREVVAEDVVWDTSATTTTSAGVVEGHDGVVRFFVDWLETWEDATYDYLEVIDAGDSILTTFRWSGSGKTSGVPVERTFYAVYDVRDRKIARYRQFDTRAEALEAAGVPPETG